MRARRLVVGCLTAVVAAGLVAAPVALGSGPAWSDDPAAATLEVPADPSGDVVVTATVDPATSPYLQVRLVRGTTVTAPYEQLDGIAPAPVANLDGSPVPVTVPTWGLGGGSAATFLLLGCASSEPSSCSILLAPAENRAITQQVLPAVTWDVPAEPVFWPQEDVTVTTGYDGGGHLQAHGPTVQALPAHGSTSLTDLPAESSRASYHVEVCSELTDDPAYCAGVEGSRKDFQYVGSHSLDVVRTSRPTVTTDLGWSGSTVHLLVYHPTGEHQLSWVLRDASGAARSASVDPGGVHQTGLDTVDVVPGSVADGPLADGTYTLDFTATWAKGDRTARATGSTPIQILNDPPADHPRVVVVRREARAGGGRTPERPAFFHVGTYPHSGYGTVRTYDAAGRRVATAQALAPCWARGCTTVDNWDVPVSAYDDAGRPLAAGRYTATFEAPDSYGRPMTVDLGEVDVQRPVLRHRFVTVPVLRARVGSVGFVGSCAAVVRPGTLQHVPGSLGLVSHASCSRSKHRADVAQQVFRVRVPQVAAADHLWSMVVRPVVHGSARRVLNTFAETAARWEGTSRWSREHLLYGGAGWKPMDWQRSSMGPALQGRWVQVRIGVDGGVRADVDRVGLRVDYYVWRTPRS